MQQPPSSGAGGPGDLYPPSELSTATTTHQSRQSQSSVASKTSGELKADVQQLGSKAVNRLHSEVDVRKGTAVTQARTVSSALERTAGELDDGAPEWLTSAFRQGAQKVQQLAESMEQKDSRQLMRDVESFARERPGVFLASCAAAGFAAARIFRAGAEQQTGQQFPSPPAPLAEAGYGSPGNDSMPSPSAREEQL